MTPEKIDQRTVGILLLVRVLVMPPMNRYPACRRVLHGAHAKNGEAMLQPFRASETAMRQQPMIAQIYAETAEHINTDNGQHDPGPAEKPRQHRQQCDEMVQPDGNRVGPDDTP